MSEVNSFKALREKIRLAQIKRRLKAAFSRKRKPAPGIPHKEVKNGN